MNADIMRARTNKGLDAILARIQHEANLGYYKLIEEHENINNEIWVYLVENGYNVHHSVTDQYHISWEDQE